MSGFCSLKPAIVCTLRTYLGAVDVTSMHVVCYIRTYVGVGVSTCVYTVWEVEASDWGEGL